jgi:DNA-binding HxlR family transcriptional regulator
MAKKANTKGEADLGQPAVKFKDCPIKVTVAVLGKKWTLLILRDIALLKINRFNRIRQSLPGLTSRVLVMRLHELEKSGLIEAVVIKDKPRVVEWALTDKGKDTVPILLSIISFGAKWYPDKVFEDHLPRALEEIFPEYCKA